MNAPMRPVSPATAGVHRDLAEVKRQLDGIRAVLAYAQDPEMLSLVEAVTTLHGAVVSLTGVVDQLTTAGQRTTGSAAPLAEG